MFNIFSRTTKLLPPYEFVQEDAKRFLNCYLKKGASDIKLVIIVGAHMAYEVDAMLGSYPNAKFILFEASQRYFSKLANRFSGHHRVKVNNIAISNQVGEVEFHETTLDGAGSLLKIGNFTKNVCAIGEAESFMVQTVTLDSYLKSSGENNEEIDCLWIDIQGAEMLALSGAIESLNQVQSVFVEISTYQPLYENAALFDDIHAFLYKVGFIVASIGTDYKNGTGNAFYIRKPAL